VLAALLALPWTLAALFATLHAGGIFFVHFFWCVGLDVLVAYALTTAFFHWLRTRESRS
jgi:hypothetical protein